MPCLPAYSSSRRRRDGPQHTALTRHTEDLEARKRQAGLVRCSHPTTTHWTPLSNNPGQMAHYCSVCVLGYCTREECWRLRGGSVRPLRDAHRRPLVHYPPVLPRHRPPEAPAQPPPAQPAGGGLLSGREGGPPSWAATPRQT
ncbi:hypothetical protein GWK47_029023 [Chionoecetes opilio]|uniref:Uncharacterized protein n=1 Tax=Chionoecetes opilio TaxID=41210 RepID=A0A8J4Z4I8_CHIOP|nr:hypothetical protein GWK47_029023 [Chionoecetes opilio]